MAGGKTAEGRGRVWEDGGGQVICPMMSRYVTSIINKLLSYIGNENITCCFIFRLNKA